MILSNGSILHPPAWRLARLSTHLTDSKTRDSDVLRPHHLLKGLENLARIHSPFSSPFSTSPASATLCPRYILVLSSHVSHVRYCGV